jgi:hypothetical protein
VELGLQTVPQMGQGGCVLQDADRAFDANWIREALTKAGIEAIIPPKANRCFPAEFDRDIYNGGT